jgi:hypothetical protein
MGAGHPAAVRHCKTESIARCRGCRWRCMIGSMQRLIVGQRAFATMLQAVCLPAKRLARVLENEARSDKDRPAMKAVGHTVLNRMQRNETASVTDVSGQYSHGTMPSAEKTWILALQLQFEFRVRSSCCCLVLS